MATILLIDDDETSRIILGRILEDGGHTVAYAKDGSAGRARAQKDAFDLIITDLAMPDVSGLRLIRELRSTGNVTGIIAVSAFCGEHGELAETYGASAFLSKPVNRSEVLSLVERELTDVFEPTTADLAIPPSL